MKSNRKLLLLIALIIAAAVTAASCAEQPETLEEYASQNSEINDDIGKAMESSDVKVDIKGNEIIYSYELSNIEGYSEEIVQNEKAVEALSEALDKSGDNFRNICSSVGSATGIGDIKVTVNYTFDGEVIVTKSFTAETRSDGEKEE